MLTARCSAANPQAVAQDPSTIQTREKQAEKSTAETKVIPLGRRRDGRRMREMQWVRPELVAQIRVVQWTAEGRLGPAALLGLRADKSALRRGERPK